MVHEGQIENSIISSLGSKYVISFFLLQCAMRFLEIKDLAVTQKIHLVVLLIAVSSCCCTGRPQTTKRLIQSFIRKIQGSGTTGSGNLLRVHLQSNAPFAPTRLSFTGSCNDSAKYTEFLMLKKYVNESLIVCLKWSYEHSYVVAIRNRTLVIEHTNNLNDHDVFKFKCATSSCTFTTLESVLSKTYVRTDSTGKALVGNNPADVTTWLNILETCVCYPSNHTRLSKLTECKLRNS